MIKHASHRLLALLLMPGASPPVFSLDLSQHCLKPLSVVVPIASFNFRSHPQKYLGVRDAWHRSDLGCVLKRNHTTIGYISSKIVKYSSDVNAIDIGRKIEATAVGRGDARVVPEDPMLDALL